MYMTERQAYMDKRYKARRFPSEFCSLITDGMQQSHAQCPQQGSAGSQLIQHPIKIGLQGSIMHAADRFLMVRTWQNVGKVRKTP